MNTDRPDVRYFGRPKVEYPKVLLIRPPQRFFYAVWPRGPRLSIPIGLLAIGSFLQGKGVDVNIYDCFVEGSDFQDDSWIPRISRGTLVQRWLRHFEDGGVTPTELDGEQRGKLQHFGATWEQLAEDIKKRNPDIVGITNLFRENTEETIKTANLVRELLPTAVIAVGGPNATALPDYMLERSGAIDIVGTGDGEQTMLDIVEWVQGKRSFLEVSGIVYRGATSSVPVPHSRTVTELDEFGHMNYDLIKLGRYFSYERAGIMARNKLAYNGAERSVSLVTSRGCPYKCSFCSIHIHAGRKYRRYSIEHTLDHLETLVGRHNVKHIHFEDDNLTLDRDRFMRLMNGVLERGLKFTWDTPNGVFANTLDERMLCVMKETGCVYLIIGVESGDQWVLDNVIQKQPLTIDHVLRAFQLAKKVGIDMQAFYIIGFPRETMKHINTTLEFAMEGLKQYDVLPHMALARADPGTDLFREAKESGSLLSDYAITNIGGVHGDMFIRHLIKTAEFGPADLEKLNHQFHGRVIRTVGWHTLLYLLRHPRIMLSSMSYFFKAVVKEKVPVQEALIKLFFCRLFYRNALLRMIEETAAPGQTPPLGQPGLASAGHIPS